MYARQRTQPYGRCYRSNHRHSPGRTSYLFFRDHSEYRYRKCRRNPLWWLPRWKGPQ